MEKSRIFAITALLLALLPACPLSSEACSRKTRAADTVYVYKTEIIEKPVFVEKEVVRMPSQMRVKPGIEVLRDNGFKPLAGKRVGLVTNPSGVDSHLKSTIEILFEAPEVNLVALYGPEHGVRGDVWAGDHISDTTDPVTGLPVFSLYGATRQPTKEMLAGIDVMVYDIQDVGTRSYTFISTLGLVMRTCAEMGIEVMVLDRPNPLGGLKVEGPYVEPGFHSFVSQYRIPYVYGLTPGEVALLINGEGLNCGQKGDQKPLKCNLTVIPMEGWTRNMLYADTGLPWVLPSPNIPTAEASICYPSAGLCGEMKDYLQIGIGYTLPFGVFAAEWVDSHKLLAKLQGYSIPGVDFREIHYKPFSGSQAGKLLHGVQYFYTDYEAAVITMTQFYVMQAIAELYPSRRPMSVSQPQGLFDKVCGTDYVRRNFAATYKVCDILKFWQKDVDDFRTVAEKYYLYTL